mgnify:CR=1 FL=1
MLLGKGFVLLRPQSPSFADYWPFLLALLGILLGGRRGKPRRDPLILRLPVFGGLVQYVLVERFCRVLGAAPDSGASPADLDAPSAVGSLVNRAAAPLPLPSNCLTRSLLLHWLLGRRGVGSETRPHRRVCLPKKRIS